MRNIEKIDSLYFERMVKVNNRDIITHFLESQRKQCPKKMEIHQNGVKRAINGGAIRIYMEKILSVVVDL